MELDLLDGDPRFGSHRVSAEQPDVEPRDRPAQRGLASERVAPDSGTVGDVGPPDR